MKRCISCLYPDTKPDLHFDEHGECSACRSYKKRNEIDWPARQEELKQILDKHNGECLVASSGGKDSTYIAIKLKELGATVTTVTATTCHLTKIGRKNLDNLANHVTTQIEVSPNKRIRARLNRLGLQLVGDVSWPEHVAIFTTPFRVSAEVGINLIFYGECPQNSYGGPEGTENAKRMTERWRSEYGGFLGLRPQDMLMEGILERDLLPYTLPNDMRGIEAYWLGQFYPWDSHENARIAIQHGFTSVRPGSANYWDWENLDNAQTGLHDFFMYRKYGYGRACAQLSVDIRMGLNTRDNGLALMKHFEGNFPYNYMGVSIEEIMDNIEITWPQLVECIHQFSNYDIHTKWVSPFG